MLVGVLERPRAMTKEKYMNSLQVSEDIFHFGNAVRPLYLKFYLTSTTSLRQIQKPGYAF